MIVIIFMCMDELFLLCMIATVCYSCSHVVKGGFRLLFLVVFSFLLFFSESNILLVSLDWLQMKKTMREKTLD